MALPDRMHCPACQGRLIASADGYRCTGCARAVPVSDGIADLTGEDSEPGLYIGDPNWNEAVWADILGRVRAAAGDRWPQDLGDVLELGCGPGQMTTALLAEARVAGLTAIDSDPELVAACRDRLSALGLAPEGPAIFAAASGRSATIRDASADTVVGMTMLPRSLDAKATLRSVHRALKPGGRAFFAVPNRRYWQAVCSGVAQAMAQRYARDGKWPDIHFEALALLARTRRLIVHRDDPAFMARVKEPCHVDSERLEDAAREVGFASAEMLPLDPDPSGGATLTRALIAVGADEDTIRGLVPLTVDAGRPYLELLSRQDRSASMLLWLTKAQGPAVTVFAARPADAPVPPADPQAILASADPRWSLELLAESTDAGIELSLVGWCLANADVLWVRVTLGEVTLSASVWRPRLDVHQVMNRAGQYPALNAICSGIDARMLFADTHPTDGRVALRFDIVLANDLTVAGPAPGTLAMNEPLVIAH